MDDPELADEPGSLPGRRATADDIAADLALAIHRGLIRPGEQVPSQAKLMESYGVAMGTAAAALGKLAAAGLARGEPGRGTYAADRVTLALKSAPVLDILAAASLCRAVASTGWPPDAVPVVRVGGHPDYGTPYEDEETLPPRPVDVSPLAALDRHVARWMSEALYEAARRAAGPGLGPADGHLLAAARAILSDGARRPEGQPPIAVYGGPVPPGEDVALRIWPERAHYAHGPDEPSF
jgi:GntR family transcriptional regulator